MCDLYELGSRSALMNVSISSYSNDMRVYMVIAINIKTIGLIPAGPMQ